GPVPTTPCHTSALRSPHRCHFFFNDPAPTETYTLSLHDALPIFPRGGGLRRAAAAPARAAGGPGALGHGPGAQRGGRHRSAPLRSEEHTSELQSRRDLVCRLLLEKKKKKIAPLRPTELDTNYSIA